MNGPLNKPLIVIFMHVKIFNLQISLIRKWIEIQHMMKSLNFSTMHK